METLMARTVYIPPSSADYKNMMTSREMTSVVDAAAQAGADHARSVSPVDTGEYRDAFSVETSVTGDRVESRIINDAPHAVIVEVGTPTQPGRNVLAQTADWIEARG
jgi:hypothetical protein